MFQLPRHIHDKVRETVLITGSARSGTSIFGKLVGSLDTVEYFFEPPTLFSLFSILDSLTAENGRFLFDTFAYEELLIGALSGRAVNLRGQDDSSIRHTKSVGEIARRMEGAARKSELDTSGATIVIKLPDFVYRVPTLAHLLQLERVLISIRDPETTLSSLLRRGWFSDTLLLAGDITWPNRFSTRIPAPHWVPEEALSEWDAMSEADRAALYYITQTELPGGRAAAPLVFDYDQLIARPRDLVRLVADRLGLAFGVQTDNILEQVAIQKTYSKYDLAPLRQDFRDRARAAYAQASERCVEI